MLDRTITKKVKDFLVLPLLFSFITIVLVIFGSERFDVEPAAKISLIENDWSVLRGGDEQQEVSLINYEIGSSKKGESITISNSVEVSSKQNTLMIFSRFSAIDVYLDQELIYSYGQEYMNKGDFVPKKYNLVTLNTNSGIHDISITYTFSEDNSAKKLTPVFYGQKEDLIRAFYSHHRISLFIGFFLVIYSCLFFSLLIYIVLRRGNGLQIYMGAFFSMLLGSYILGRSDIFCFVGNHQMLLSMIEYTSFYTIPLGFSILLYSIHGNTLGKRLSIMTVINIVFPIIILILHFTDLVYINRFFNAVGVLDFIEILWILPTLIRSAIKQQKALANSDLEQVVNAEFYIILGFIMMIIMFLIEVGSKFFERFYNDTLAMKTSSTINFLELGMLYFVMCHFIYYFMNSINHMSADRVKVQLEGLAYTDVLTGLKNRAACGEIYPSLSGEYAIISFDLDKLKSVNDNQGHLTGDNMIKAFADILSVVFESADIVARTGGDEFVVIIKNPDKNYCKQRIDNLMSKIQHFNKYNDEYSLSVSAGYAYSDETESGKYSEVFYLADQRMYKMKEEHHG